MGIRGCSGLFAEVNKHILQHKCICVLILHGCIARYAEGVPVLGNWSFILGIVNWRASEQPNNNRAVSMGGQSGAAKAQYSFWRTDWEISYMNKEVLLFQLSWHEEGLACFFSSCFDCLSESYNCCYESRTSGTNDMLLFWVLIVILQKKLWRIEKDWEKNDRKIYFSREKNEEILSV